MCGIELKVAKLEKKDVSEGVKVLLNQVKNMWKEVKKEKGIQSHEDNKTPKKDHKSLI